MSASKSIQETCLHLMEQLPFTKITVEQICAEAFVARSTFYKLYKDKYDVVETIYRNDIIDSFSELYKILPNFDEQIDRIAVEWFFQRFYDKRKFYKNLMLSCGNDWFLNIFIESYTELYKKYTKNIETSLSPIMYDYACYYFSASEAMLLKKWLEEDCIVSVKEIAKASYEWGSSYWRRTFFEK